MGVQQAEWPQYIFVHKYGIEIGGECMNNPKKMGETPLVLSPVED
jgi:hypothetical protein